jgi:hypothetical protein
MDGTADDPREFQQPLLPDFGGGPGDMPLGFGTLLRLYNI